MTAQAANYCVWCRHRSLVKCCPWCLKDLLAWIRPLAANLATAAGLCRAFDLGGDSGRWWSSYFEGFYQDDDDVPAWDPGCGRSAP